MPKTTVNFFEFFRETVFLKIDKNEKYENPHYAHNMEARGLKFWENHF